jgi:type IV pilus assembly protein PilQ
MHRQPLSRILISMAPLWVALPAAAAPANVITGIEVQDGDTTRVVIRGSQEPTFTVFRLGQPPRVVVDLANADLSQVKVPAESRSAEAAVSLVTTTQFRDPSHPIGRVVVGLSRDIPFDVKAEGHSVVVTLTGPQRAATPVAAAPANPPAEGTTTAQAAPKDEPAAKDEPIVVENPAKDTATRLVSVAGESRPGGGAVLTLRTNGPVARYEVQEVTHPTRLVVDLYGIQQAPKAAPALKKGPLSRVRLGKHDTHVRVVMDARGDTLPHFDVVSTEDGVMLAFAAPEAAPRAAEQKAGAPAAVVAEAALPAEPANAVDAAPSAAGKGRVEDVKFDEKDGFFRLRVATKGAVNHRLSVDNPRLKVLELRDVDLPRNLERSMDTTAFAGPVQAVATFRDPDSPGVVKVAVDLGADVEHRVWQKGDAMYWDFRAANAKPAAAQADEDRADTAMTRTAGFAVEAASLSRQGAPAQRRYTGRRITIDLKEADILNVLRLIAEVSKLNIIASDQVKGNITIKLRNVPWDQALDIILKVKALGQEKNGNIIRVAPVEVLNLEKLARDNEIKQRQVLDPTVVKLLPVNYAQATEMLPQVQALLSTRGKATVDKRTNVIIVEDVKDNVYQAERLVRSLDTQTPQVLIEARIVEATASWSRTLGIQWGYGLNLSESNGSATPFVFPNNVGAAGGADDPLAARSALADPGVVGPTNYAVNMPASLSGPGSTALGFNLGSVGNVLNLSLRLSAAEQEGSVKVVSSPKIATLDNKTARISQGVDIPVARVNVQGVQTQLIPSALELEVTPHITADGSVLMKMRITNNQPDFSRQVQGIPSFTKKEADTEVMVHDGETTVVGGIYTRNTAENYRRSPFLGSLPVVGWLFRNQDKSDARQELLAFITPRIANRATASVPAGTELGGRQGR